MAELARLAPTGILPLVLRDQAGNEVGLLVETDQRLIAIECKVTECLDSQDLRGLKRLSAFYGAEAISHAYIACTTRQPYDPAMGTTAINGWTVWELPAAGD